MIGDLVAIIVVNGARDVEWWTFVFVLWRRRRFRVRVDLVSYNILILIHLVRMTTSLHLIDILIDIL